MKTNIAIAALFFFLACVATFPLCFHLTDLVSYGNRSGDHLFFLWNLWWAKKSIVDLGTNPYFTDYLFYPQGKSLLIHSLVLPYGVLSIPLQVLLSKQTGLILSYNLITVVSIVLSGYFTWLYVWRLTGDRLAGIASGAIFAFSPFTIWHLNNLEFLSIFWLPIAACLTHRVVESGKAKYAVLLALAFALAVYTSYSMALYLLFFVTVAFIYHLFRRGPRGLPGSVVVLFYGLSTLLVFPILLPSLCELGDFIQPGEVVIKGSSNLLAYVVPCSPRTLPGRLGLGSDFGSNGMSGCETFLGYVPLLLCVFALTGRRAGKMWFWLILGIAAAVLSLGPYLHISRWLVKAPLPYYFIAKVVPPINVYRAPGRFSILVAFSVSVMAGYGFTRLRSLLRSKGGLLCALVVALVMVEFCPFPNLLVPLGYPRIFDRIAEEEGDFAVLELPIGDFFDGCFYMYGQTIHEKKLLGGMTSRLTGEDFSLLRSLPPVIAVSNGKVEEELVERLKGLGVKYVIYHGRDPEPDVVKIY